MIGVFRLESQMLPGNGKIERTGLGSDSKCKEAVNTAFNYLKANGNRIRRFYQYLDQRLYHQLSGFAGDWNDREAGTSYVDCSLLDCAGESQWSAIWQFREILQSAAR